MHKSLFACLLKILAANKWVTFQAEQDICLCDLNAVGDSSTWQEIYVRSLIIQRAVTFFLVTQICSRFLQLLPFALSDSDITACNFFISIHKRPLKQVFLFNTTIWMFFNFFAFASFISTHYFLKTIEKTLFVSWKKNNSETNLILILMSTKDFISGVSLEAGLPYICWVINLWWVTNLHFFNIHVVSLVRIKGLLK